MQNNIIKGAAFLIQPVKTLFHQGLKFNFPMNMRVVVLACDKRGYRFWLLLLLFVLRIHFLQLVRPINMDGAKRLAFSIVENFTAKFQGVVYTVIGYLVTARFSANDFKFNAFMISSNAFDKTEIHRGCRSMIAQQLIENFEIQQSIFIRVVVVNE